MPVGESWPLRVPFHGRRRLRKPFPLHGYPRVEHFPLPVRPVSKPRPIALCLPAAKPSCLQNATFPAPEHPFFPSASRALRPDANKSRNLPDRLRKFVAFEWAGGALKEKVAGWRNVGRSTRPSLAWFRRHAAPRNLPARPKDHRLRTRRGARWTPATARVNRRRSPAVCRGKMQGPKLLRKKLKKMLARSFAARINVVVNISNALGKSKTTSTQNQHQT